MKKIKFLQNINIIYLNTVLLEKLLVTQIVKYTPSLANPKVDWLTVEAKS